MIIIIQNFRFYKGGPFVFEFCDSSLNLFKGDSGSGKSTVFIAILWCMFGGLRGNAIKPLNSSKSSYCKYINTPHIDTCSDLKAFAKTEMDKIGISPKNTGVIISTNNWKISRRLTTTSALEVLILPEETLLTGKDAETWISKKFGSKTAWLSTSYIQQKTQNPLITASNADKFTILFELAFGNNGIEDRNSPEFMLTKLSGMLSDARKKANITSAAKASAKDVLDSHLKNITYADIEPSEFNFTKDDLVKVISDIRLEENKLQTVSLAKKDTTRIQKALEYETDKLSKLKLLKLEYVDTSVFEISKTFKRYTSRFKCNDLSDAITALEKFDISNLNAIKRGCIFSKRVYDTIRKYELPVEIRFDEDDYESIWISMIIEAYVKANEFLLLSKDYNCDSRLLDNRIDEIRTEVSMRNKIGIIKCNKCGSNVSYSGNGCEDLSDYSSDELNTLLKKLVSDSDLMSITHKIKKFRDEIIIKALTDCGVSIVDFDESDFRTCNEPTPIVIFNMFNAAVEIKNFGKVEFFTKDPDVDMNLVNILESIDDLQTDYNNILDSFKAVYKLFGNNVYKINESIFNCERINLKNESVERDIIETSNRVEELNSEIKAAQLNTIEIDNEHLDNLRKRETQIRNSISCDIIRNSIKQAQEKIKTATSDETIANEEVNAISELLKFTNMVGVKTLLEMIESLNNLTNQILFDLFDGSSEMIQIELVVSEKKTMTTASPSAGNTIGLIINQRDVTFENTSGILSGGELDRLSCAITIAMNILTDSPFIIFDECMSSITAMQKEKCISTIRKFIPHKTVIEISHIEIPGVFHDYIIEV